MSKAGEDGWARFSPVERAMARRMERTVDVPIATEFTHVDIAAALALVKQQKADGIPSTFTGLVIAATAVALREFPEVAAEVDYENWTRRIPEAPNVGVAVDSERGLVVPVFQGITGKSGEQLLTEFRDTVDVVRAGSPDPKLFAGGHLSITSMGTLEVYGGFPLPSTPQIAILGISGSWDAPVVVDGEIKVSRVARFTIALDHRALDGMTAGRFIVRLKHLVEAPETIFAALASDPPGA